MEVLFTKIWTEFVFFLKIEILHQRYCNRYFFETRNRSTGGMQMSENFNQTAEASIRIQLCNKRRSDWPSNRREQLGVELWQMEIIVVPLVEEYLSTHSPHQSSEQASSHTHTVYNIIYGKVGGLQVVRQLSIVKLRKLTRYFAASLLFTADMWPILTCMCFYLADI